MPTYQVCLNRHPLRISIKKATRDTMRVAFLVEILRGDFFFKQIGTVNLMALNKHNAAVFSPSFFRRIVRNRLIFTKTYWY